MSDNVRPEAFQSIDSLITESIKVIIKEQDYAAFHHWLQRNLSRHLPEAPTALEAPKLHNSMTLTLSRALWNCTPLPKNGYRPDPLPDLKRNDPCPCGSGRKFKQCCYQAPAPQLPVDHIWTLVLGQLNKTQLKAALASKRVPLESLALLAQDYLENGQPGKAVQVLQPAFDNAAQLKGNELADEALNLLCDAYDTLGHWKKKLALLDQVIKTQPRSTLRSGAWQRLAANAADAGATDKAWEFFANAQKDDPDSTSLSYLEVRILLEEGRIDEAQRRAQFWHKRLLRAGLDADEPLLEFLAGLAKDPHQAMGDLVGDMFDWDIEKEFADWIPLHQDRPLPEYRCAPFPAAEICAPDDDLADDLFGGPEEDAKIPGVLLQPPAEIAALEQAWFDVCPIGKPISIHNAPSSLIDPWDDEPEWFAFLKAHPAAWDSLEILDDLAGMLYLRDDFGAPWVIEDEMLPILERAASIVMSSVTDDTRLPWDCLENRPALRTLSRLIEISDLEFERAQAQSYARRIIRLNPNDNHGYRTWLITTLLQAGEDQQALDLTDAYPNDIQADIAYGRVLALYRLARLEDALAALADALASLPKIPHFLTRARVRKPKLHEQGISIGGDDQAWLYREQMRDTWQETAGALDWLKKAVKTLAAGR